MNYIIIAVVVGEESFLEHPVFGSFSLHRMLSTLCVWNNKVFFGEMTISVLSVQLLDDVIFQSGRDGQENGQ